MAWGKFPISWGGGMGQGRTGPNSPANISTPTAVNKVVSGRGGTLARAIALKAAPKVEIANTLHNAMQGKIMPRRQVSVRPTFTSPLSDPTTGMRRLVGAEESPADKHDRLYAPRIMPIVKAKPYKPAWGFMKLSPESTAAMAKVFGDPNKRKDVDRTVRSVLRDGIAKQRADKAQYAHLGDNDRVTGLEYLRTRKMRPNVPQKVRGSSFQISRDNRLRGKFSGLRSTPVETQEKIRTVAIGARKLIPFTPTSEAKTPVIWDSSIFGKLFKSVTGGA